MEELRDLNELAKEVVRNFNEKFDARDCKIPMTFKEKVKKLKSFTVVYNDYSVIIKGDGIRSKDSYVPNQSFYMASFFIEYSYELSKYKQKIMPLLYNADISTSDLTSFFTHERDKGKEDVEKGEDKFVKILDNIGYNKKDREFLIKFVTNYDWWSGSKTIERSDFFNSPVLSIMGLTASSNAAMAMIVDHLTQHPECADLLLKQAEDERHIDMNNSNYQQIFYGAPGTGKSYKVSDTTEHQPKENVFRTTFHPDSDYSTFVGCYKPTKIETKFDKRTNLSMEDLAKELNRYYNSDNLGKIGGFQKFCYEYCHYLDGKYMNINIKKLLEMADVPQSFSVEINKYINFYHLFPKQEPAKITYEFIPQAFTRAYVEAWKKKDNIFLVIEEINRGNCAQIFGDLFQLLDRKDGVSEYPIEADTDLSAYLKEMLKNSQREDIPEEVKSGKKLTLPSNLFIWATMNTSDQSLFPMDSAFKRRWSWEYVPIDYNNEKSGAFTITIDGEEYNWHEFLKAVNEKIKAVTSSEDKQMGNFFIKNNINEKEFCDKVMFYLWSEIGKDNYKTNDAIFRYYAEEDNLKEFSFNELYEQSKRTEILKGFIRYIEEEKKV